jgi:hypothetical protein
MNKKKKRFEMEILLGFGISKSLPPYIYQTTDICRMENLNVGIGRCAGALRISFRSKGLAK